MAERFYIFSSIFVKLRLTFPEICINMNLRILIILNIVSGGELKRMKTIELGFEGYWLDQYKAELPHEAGIYCVYACEPMAQDKIVVIRDLIHVGVADNIAKSVMAADTSAWKKSLHEGESLCYSFSNVKNVEEKIKESIIEQSQY